MLETLLSRMRLTRKVTRNLQDYGPGVTAQKSVAALLAPIYCHRIYRIYRIDLTEALTPYAEQADFRLTALQAEDSASIESIERLAEHMRGHLAREVRDGALCLCLHAPEGLVAFNLVSFTTMSMPLIRLSLTLRPGKAWSNQITVAPRWRRRGLATQLRFAMFEELRQRGIRRFYGGTLRANQPALQLSRRAGFCEIVDIEYTRVLGRERRVFRRVRDPR